MPHATMTTNWRLHPSPVGYLAPAFRSLFASVGSSVPCLEGGLGGRYTPARLRVPANMKDYNVRMREFFDHHLMGKSAPKWWVEGVPLLKLKDHLDERAPGKPTT